MKRTAISVLLIAILAGIISCASLFPEEQTDPLFQVDAEVSQDWTLLNSLETRTMLLFQAASERLGKKNQALLYYGNMAIKINRAKNSLLIFAASSDEFGLPILNKYEVSKNKVTRGEMRVLTQGLSKLETVPYDSLDFQELERKIRKGFELFRPMQDQFLI